MDLNQNAALLQQNGRPDNQPDIAVVEWSSHSAHILANTEGPVFAHRECHTDLI